MSAQPDELLQSILSRKLITITGTGFSRFASGDPSINGHQVASWPGLLRHGFEYCINNGLHGSDSINDVKVQLEEHQTRQLVSAGQTILDWLNNQRQNWLNVSIGQLRLKHPELVRVLKLLSPHVLITLNYDDLIEQGTGYPFLDWTQHDAIAAVLREEACPHVIHLHGHWKKAQNVVADFFAYRDITKDRATRALMHDLFVYHRLLFVGCRGTFEDPHFKDVIRDVSELGRDYSHCHYVLCRKSELDDIQGLLRSTMLRPLIYGESYEDLTPFLEGLGRDAGVDLENNAVAGSAVGVLRQKPSLNFQRASEIWKRRVSE
jgi:hypothetical protein